MSNDQTGVAGGIVRLFKEAHQEAAARANVERAITEAFEHVGEPKPDATPEERAQRWDAVFEHMWRGLGLNVLPFPDRNAGDSTITSDTSPEGGAA